jgi:GPI ethanolamine phosphate transferase 3 subunit O
MPDALPPPKDYATIKAQYEAAREAKRKEDEATAKPSNGTNRQRKKTAAVRTAQVNYKVGLLMAWFGIIMLLHALGLYLFMNGFLLTRLVLNDLSECAVLPIEEHSVGVGSGDSYKTGSWETGCWHSKTFDRAVVVVIDALRYDFTVPFQPRDGDDRPRHFHNGFPVLYETAEKYPENAVLLPFIADPPTTTLQRLKGLTTGTLPTFIDAGTNFAGTAIDEDNLIAQAKSGGKIVVHLGDDTWHSLFPGYFEPNLTRPYDSFNVWDLHTVDNGVIEHLEPLLTKENITKWDILIGHLLGVDHAGHRYGPDHPAMNSKLNQMDKFIRSVMSKIDDKTLLLVMGDHGMDGKGDHGGESDEEVQAAIWMYSKRRTFGRRPGYSGVPLVATDRPVAQIDLVPTLSLLLGLPIPFNNLGAPIYEAFASIHKSDYKNLASVYRLTAGQIARYMKRYAEVRKLDSVAVSASAHLWDMAESLLHNSKSSRNAQAIFEAYDTYQKEVLSLCRSLWARFNVPSMIAGIGVLSLALIILLTYASAQGDLVDLSPHLVRVSGLGTAVGTVVGLAASLYLYTPLLPTISFSTASGAILGSIWALASFQNRLRIPLPTSWPAWLSVLFTVGLSGGLASNSYTVWEDRTVMFLLGTISVILFVVSLRQPKSIDQAMGCFQSALFVILARISTFSRLCREEQMPYCISTYYASSSSSTSAAWHLIVPVIVAFSLPGLIKQFYQATHSYHHSAILWYGFAFRGALWLSAAFWILNTADDHDWFNISNIPWLKDAKVVISQISLGISLAVGYSIYGWAAPFLSITSKVRDPSAPPTPGIVSADGTSNLSILGYANIHGTRYFPLIALWASTTILLQKPLGGGTIALLVWQILALLETLSSTNLLSSPLAPLTLSLLGALHFFTTGHQATLASLQWDTAFIPLHTLRLPWSAILIFINTFGAPLLTALAVPLLALWRAPARKRGLLGEVARATARHVSVHATIALATSVWAMHLRRHLMLFRVFCPRWMFAAVTLFVVDVGVVLLGIGGTRWSFLSVDEILEAGI